VSGLEEMSREQLIALTRVLLAENARLTERVAVLEKENAELRERVARLERLISRNSGNSGMPPAGDDLPGKPRPKDKPAKAAAGRRRGKQPGTPGTTLAWSNAPDDTLDRFPSGACACGADLADAIDLGVTARHQQIDVPLMAATTVQHNLHTVVCGCGKVHAAPRRMGCRRRRSASGSICRRGACI
jgi:transposase